MSGEQGQVAASGGKNADVRSDLASIIFQAVRLVRDLPVGFAFAFKDDPIWTNRINEFVRLEKLARPEFEFKMEPDETISSQVWMYWLGDRTAIEQEIKALSPQFNPLGRVTVLREEPLVSVLLTADAEPTLINRLIPQIFEQIRTPVEVIAAVSNPDTIFRPYEMRCDQRLAVLARGNSPYQAALEEARGDVVIFVDALVQPNLLRRMVEYINDQHLIIGARPDSGENAPSTITQLVNRMAGLMIGGDVQDYLSPLLLIRRRSLSALGMEINSRADFLKLIRSARKAGMSVIEVSD